MTPTTALQALIKAIDDNFYVNDHCGMECSKQHSSKFMMLVEDARAALSAPAQDAQAFLVEDRTVYVLNSRGANRWSALVQPGQDDEGRRVTDDECRRIAQLLAARTQPATPARASITVIGEQVGYYTWERADGAVTVAQQSPGGCEWHRGVPCAIYMHAGIATPPAAPQAVPQTDLLSELDALADPEGNLCGVHEGPERDELQRVYNAAKGMA